MKKIISILLFSCLAFTAKASEKTSYTFGVVPQSATLKVAKLWSPLLRHMTRESGVKLKFKTAKDIDEFERQLAAGEYDFVYMDPYQYITYHQAIGYQAIAKRKDQPLKGIVVVPKDSPIQSMDELNNTEIAFSSPTSFGSSLLPQQEISAEGIDYTPRYIKSDDSVYLAVSKGLFKAGGGIEVTLSSMKKKVRNKLKVIWSTEEYTPHAVAAHPGVPQAVVDSVQKAFVELRDDKKCSIQLKKLNINSGLEVATNTDWNDIRSLGFNKL